MRPGYAARRRPAWCWWSTSSASRWLSAAQKNVLWGLVLVRLLMLLGAGELAERLRISRCRVSVSSPPQQVPRLVACHRFLESRILWVVSEGGSRGAAAASGVLPTRQRTERTPGILDDYVFLAV